MSDRYDDYYDGRHAGPRASDGAGSYGSLPFDEDDIAPYRRDAYGSASRRNAPSDGGGEPPAEARYRRADSRRSENGRNAPLATETHDERHAHHADSAELYDFDAAPETDVRAAPPRKKRNGKRIAAIVAAVVAVAVLAGAGIAFAYMNNISSNMHEGVDQDLRDALVETDMANKPFYVLLLGTDQSAERDEMEELGGVYRSDSIMLARIDPVQKKVALVSIPRDTKIDLGEYGVQKINAARAFGGPALAVEAVSKLAGVKISHYAEINFDGFQAIVDALGGVEVDVPIDIDDPDAGGALAAGVQTLNGEQALVLCRSRESYNDVAIDPDMMRAANQRMVLSAIARKLLDSDVATIASTVSAMSKNVTTDLELNDIIGIAQTMKGLDPESDIFTATMPGTSEYIRDDPLVPEGWYEIVDEKAWKSMVKRMDAGEPPSDKAQVDEKTGTVIATAGGDVVDKGAKVASIDVKNGTERDGLAASAKRLLAEYGFANVTTGQATTKFKYPSTLVIYDNPAQAYEADQIVSALGQGKAMVNDGTYLFESDFLVVIGEDWQGQGAPSDAGVSEKLD